MAVHRRCEAEGGTVFLIIKAKAEKAAAEVVMADVCWNVSGQRVL